MYMDLVQGKLSVSFGFGTRSCLRGGRTLVALVRCRARVPVPGDSS